MSEEVQKLNENLKKQVALYEEFFAQEQDKQKALLQNNLKELDVITAREGKLLHEANLLEKERLLWAEHIGRKIGKTPEDLTLAELVEHFPVLKDVSCNLDQVVSSLQEIHELNAQLLQQAMKVVDFTIGMLTHQKKNTYGHPSRKDNKENIKLHLLDRRI